ncbi:MAG: substrate-binding domain-containing protein [Lachnospiraceae bacterium]|nr:substrate-binding domain-containing protein [Robinsoniella sp.]MDY3766598.1 substrate-binding domain-containing protein [Lachnospiraceae bacterium]
MDKKCFFRIALSLGFFCSVLCLSIVSHTTTLAGEANHRITCIIPSRQETVFWKEIDDSIRDAADDCQLELTMLYTNSSEQSMTMSLNDAIETAILFDTEAIITSYTKANADTDELLKRARQAGIYVIFLDCDGPPELRDVYVGIDNEAAGYAIGMYAKNQLEDGEKALLCYSLGEQNIQNFSERLNGIIRAFESCPDSIQTFSLSDSNDLMRILELETYITHNASIKALIATRERATIVSSQLLSRLDMSGEISLYGFDQSDETMSLLENNQITALVCQQHYDMGYQSVILAHQLLEGETLLSDFCKIDFLILSANGIEETQNRMEHAKQMLLENPIIS